MSPKTHKAIQKCLVTIQVEALKLLSCEDFINELSGEDEVMLGTFLDFIIRLDEEHEKKSEEYTVVVESPEQWRQQQDAETD